ncbi:MAG TPA: hypothetical protein ENJ82_04680, partial [Bacteroidetes bacterium]|nr:hypothetical protein [Bacteroidota bacterium]
MYRIGIVFILLCLPFFSPAQKEGDIWFFAKGIFFDFAGGSPVVGSNAQAVTNQGSSSISDKNGNLLFYSNGYDLLNRAHLPPQGWNPPLSYAGAGISLQGVLFLPINDSIVFHFTLHPAVANPGYGSSVRYDILSSRANNGLGAVISTYHLLGDSLAQELAAVRHADGESWWVLTHYTRSDVFVKYHIATDGTITRSDQQIGAVYPPLWDYYTSPLTFNEQGDRFSIAVSQGRF